MGNNEKIEEMLAQMERTSKEQIADYIAKEANKFEKYKEKVQKYAYEPIEILGLAKRSYRILKEERFKTVGDLICTTREDLDKLRRGFGRKSLNDVICCLNKYGLTLKSG